MSLIIPKKAATTKQSILAVVADRLDCPNQKQHWLKPDDVHRVVAQLWHFASSIKYICVIFVAWLV